jgi:hypothetical protein
MLHARLVVSLPVEGAVGLFRWLSQLRSLNLISDPVLSYSLTVIGRSDTRIVGSNVGRGLTTSSSGFLITNPEEY